MSPPKAVAAKQRERVLVWYATSVAAFGTPRRASNDDRHLAFPKVLSKIGKDGLELYYNAASFRSHFMMDLGLREVLGNGAQLHLRVPGDRENT